jgi:hypothetical protein
MSALAQGSFAEANAAVQQAMQASSKVSGQPSFCLTFSCAQMHTSCNCLPTCEYSITCRAPQLYVCWPHMQHAACWHGHAGLQLLAFLRLRHSMPHYTAGPWASDLACAQQIIGANHMTRTRVPGASYSHPTCCALQAASCARASPSQTRTQSQQRRALLLPLMLAIARRQWPHSAWLQAA